MARELTDDAGPGDNQPTAPQRIGVFGGTFDPPHIGHFATAVNVAAELDLDQMLLVVANSPWQKLGTRPITPAEDRYAMVAAGAALFELVEASRIELDRGGETYSADTLEELRELHPTAELFLVVGSDAADGLDTWKRPDVVRELATIVVVDRAGREGGVPPQGWNYVKVDTPRLEVSSSDLRRRAEVGDPLDVLIPAAVIDVIRGRSLYRRHD
ncbi:MAG: nicotinate (nicotinamide) nucleotide adenylyltransferase [Acidimicrobiales bacterium]|nr:nicotinate (nicotinamide) nucleotide adenylyltransferase [Acidimicrobiales bacterium]